VSAFQLFLVTGTAFLRFNGDTYGKISDDFKASCASLGWRLILLRQTCDFCLPEPTSAEASPALQDNFAVRHGSLFSHFRVQLGAALAKAAGARFVRDSVDDGLPIRVLYEHNSASQAPDIPDLPLYHMPS
jgi:hypothetical protein